MILSQPVKFIKHTLNSYFIKNEFTDKEAVDIIARAESYRQYEEIRKALSENGLIEKVLSENKILDREAILDIAKEKGIDIPPEYINEVIKRFYSSEEERLGILKKHKAKPTQKSFELTWEKIANLYRSKIEKELHKFSLPNEEIKGRLNFKSMDYHISNLSFYKKSNSLRKKLFWKKLAKFEFNFSTVSEDNDWNFGLDADFYDANFLNQCSDIILELNKNIENQGEVIYEPKFHYAI